MRKLLMVLCAAFGAVLIWPGLSFAADWVYPGQADHEEVPIVVSLGDSYSSGEGMEPYYGQGSESKYRNEDWICHRSQTSWPGKLEFNGVQLSSVIGTNYNCADGLTSIVAEDGNWYFGAVSGAVTNNIYSEDENDRQVKEVYQTRVDIDNAHTLNFQLGMITSLPEPEAVDYVTLTIGGNDVGFTEIVTESLFPDYINLSRKGLKQKLIDTVDSFWVTDDGSTPMAEKLENTYRKILEAAPNAKLIVAGYPKLIYQDETQILNSASSELVRASSDLTTKTVNNMFATLTISESEAKLIDEAVSAFDTYIGTVISQRMDGENIAFVDVQDAFAGHEAYSDDPYLEQKRGYAAPVDVLMDVGVLDKKI